jgi:hypothetical protein
VNAASAEPDTSDWSVLIADRWARRIPSPLSVRAHRAEPGDGTGCEDPSSAATAVSRSCAENAPNLRRSMARTATGAA